MTSDIIVLDDAALEAIADLQIQAMLFDARIDWERLELDFTKPVKQAQWLTNWRDKEQSGDRTPEDYEA